MQAVRLPLQVSTSVPESQRAGPYFRSRLLGKSTSDLAKRYWSLTMLHSAVCRSDRALKGSHGIRVWDLINWLLKFCKTYATRHLQIWFERHLTCQFFWLTIVFSDSLSSRIWLTGCSDSPNSMQVSDAKWAASKPSSAEAGADHSIAEAPQKPSLVFPPGPGGQVPVSTESLIPHNQSHSVSKQWSSWINEAESTY